MWVFGAARALLRARAALALLFERSRFWGCPTQLPASAAGA